MHATPPHWPPPLLHLLHACFNLRQLNGAHVTRQGPLPSYEANSRLISQLPHCITLQGRPMRHRQMLHTMASGVPGSVHAAISTKVRAQLHYSLLHYLLQLQLGKVVPICDGFHKEHNRSSRACHAAKEYLAVGHHCCSNHSAGDR